MVIIKPSSLLLLIAFSYCLIQGSFYPLWVLCFSMIHEAGHLLAIRHFGGHAEKICSMGQGFEIRFNGLSYRQEFFAAAAGPFTNFLIFIPFSLLALLTESNGLWYCAFSNLLLAIINLLPIYPLDGGRMLSCILAPRYESAVRQKALQIAGLCAILPLLAAAFWQFLSSGYNLSLFLICIYLAALTAAQSKGEYP